MARKSQPAPYQLAASALPQNSATNTFHDVTPQTSGVALCDIGTPSMCNNSTPAPGGLSGGLAGYPLTTGYDLATGLGSINVIGLLNAATAPVQRQVPVSVYISSNPGSINFSQTTQFFASLGPAAAGPSTGTVQFLSNGGAIRSPVPVSLRGEAVSDPLGFSGVGTYTADQHLLDKKLKENASWRTSKAANHA